MHASECEAASTSIIHRPFGLAADYRVVTDRSSSVSVHAFPPTLLQRLSAAGRLTTPGAYILTDLLTTAYIGESNRPARRLAEHVLDCHKRSFTREIYAVVANDGSAFDKPLALDLQFRLTRLAIDAGKVAVAKGSNPTEPQLSAADRSTHDRIFADARRLIHDAGCHIFGSASTPIGASDDVAATISSGPDNDGGTMEIGVTTTPVGSEEFELRYDDVWARGYWADDHFIVAAGSEVREQTNGSCDALTRRRRDELFQAGVLARIPGIGSRRRLTAAVALPTISVAAKVICGTHTAARWMPLVASKVVVLARARQAP